MSSARRDLSFLLVLWTAVAPFLAIGCQSPSMDKRILQYAITEGIGKQYVGNSQQENYVSIGDALTYVDTFNPEVRGTAMVGIDGTIFVPEAGSVIVAGMTRSELETHLTQKLSPYYVETDVQVMIRTGGGKVFYVLGEVARPGPKPFRGGLNMLDAVLLSGPREYSANLSRVRLIRADPVDPLILRSNITAIMRGDSTTNYVVNEYDIIYVPPTLLQQVADLMLVMVTPLTRVLSQVVMTLLQVRYWDDPRMARLGRGRYF